LTAEKLIELLEKRPFSPLRIRLIDGRSFEIFRSEMAIVTPAAIAIGLTNTVGSRIAERITNCAISHIVEVEPVDPTAGRSA
jgi:hypothetical protein